MDIHNGNIVYPMKQHSIMYFFILGNRSNATYSKSSKIEGTSDELQYSSAISCSSFEDVIEESESQLSCNNSEESIKPGETEQIVDFYFQSKYVCTNKL